MTFTILFYIIVLLLAFAGYRYYHHSSITPLQIGQTAPAFELPDAQGKMVSLSQFKGQWLVLYFYPKNDTPGCTKEACHFRDDMHQLEKLGAKVVGISVDDRQSHAEFSKKYALPFPLLSDSDGKVAGLYHALTSLGPLKMAKRYTFLINPEGQFAQIYLNVDTSKHSQQIIEDLTHLQR